MSEERRKRQQAGEKDSSKTKKVILYVVVAALFVGAYLAGRYYKSHKYDSFARCLATKNARMYGLYWCPHCADQKHEFGSSFRYVSYIECASENDPHELTQPARPPESSCSPVGSLARIRRKKACSPCRSLVRRPGAACREPFGGA